MRLIGNLKFKLVINFLWIGFIRFIYSLVFIKFFYLDLEKGVERGREGGGEREVKRIFIIFNVINKLF